VTAAGPDTPVVTVDLDAVERNVARMQDYCDGHGLAFMPHTKTHKLPALAHMQVRAGAAGIACQKLGEAEVMLAAGLREITITFPILGEAKLRRLVPLCREGRITLVADSEPVVRGLSGALAAAGTSADLLVECDTGFGRTGVQTPQAAAELAALAAELPGLRPAGLMTFPTLPGSGAWLERARTAVEAAGVAVERVSGGGTPTAFATHESPAITELRAGTYVYGDRSCIANGTVSLEDCALRVRATVASRPAPGRAILDAGSKTLSSDPTVSAEETGYGFIVEHPEAVVYGLSEEHGHVDVDRCADPPAVGDVVTIVPNHACATTNLHDTVLVHRGGETVGVWPVAARGKVS
jgi:D-serine deaminase-like pyridoxal phosphate-dependent protein